MLSLTKPLQEFLRVIGASSEFLEEDGEVGFILEEETFTLVMMDDRTFLLESVIAPLPFSKAAKKDMLEKILQCNPAFFFQFPQTVALSNKVEDVVLQEILPQEIKRGVFIMERVIAQKHALSWWRKHLGVERDKPKGKNLSLEKKAPPVFPAQWA